MANDTKYESSLDLGEFGRGEASASVKAAASDSQKMSQSAEKAQKAFEVMSDNAKSSSAGLQSMNDILEKIRINAEKYSQSLTNIEKSNEKIVSWQKQIADLEERISKARDKKDGTPTQAKAKLLARKDEQTSWIRDEKKRQRAYQETADKELELSKRNKQVLNALKSTMPKQDKTTGLVQGGAHKFTDRNQGVTGGGLYSGAMEVASDLHIPGLSHAATIGKYAGKGAVKGAEMVSRVAPAMGELGGVAGLGIGTIAGAAIAAGGYTALQGYKVYQTAHEMAPMSRTLVGQMGAEGGTSATRGAITAYGGYGGVENLQALMNLNRQVGANAGYSQLNKTTDLANATGLSREDIASQMGTLVRGGGATGLTAGRDLEKIMIDAVKGGMDKARITEYTQNVMGIQEEMFRATGENSVDKISKSLSSMMSAYGGDKAAFARGPEMAAMRGMDATIKGASSGGFGSGTIIRALGGFGEGKMADMYSVQKRLESGIWGDQKGERADKNIMKMFSQFEKEYGGGKSGIKAMNIAGMGNITQLEKLKELAQKSVAGTATKKEKAELKTLQNETGKSDMQKLLDIQAKSNEGLAKLASSKEGIAAVVAIDTTLLSIQQKALVALEYIAKKGYGMEDNVQKMKESIGPSKEAMTAFHKNQGDLNLGLGKKGSSAVDYERVRRGPESVFGYTVPREKQKFNPKTDPAIMMGESKNNDSINAWLPEIVKKLDQGNKVREQNLEQIKNQNQPKRQANKFKG